MTAPFDRVPARRLCAAPLLGVPRLARARVDVDVDIDIDDAMPRVVVVDARRRLSRPTLPWDRARISRDEWPPHRSLVTRHVSDIHTIHKQKSNP